MNDRDEVGNAGKKLAVIRKNELVVEIFFESFGSPPLSSARAPVAKHFPADDDVLHRKNVDMLNWPARSLVIEIKFANRIDAVAKEFDAHGITHQRREDIDDSSANREFAWRTDRFLAQVAGVF